MNIFYSLYNVVLGNAKLDSYYKRLIVRLTNIILPLYYSISGLFYGKNVNDVSADHKSNKYIVSLTTFPNRIENVWIVIETIMRQTVKPDEIVLWLYKGEFKDIESLPKRLRRLQSRGLTIRFCNENLKPHKKYYYTLKENPDAFIITVDDDLMYPPDLVQNLIVYSKQFKGAICCAMAHKIIVSNEGVMPYITWEKINYNTAASKGYHILSGGGTIFPPSCLHSDVINKELLKRFALSADDLWLKIQSLRKGTKVVCFAGEYKRAFMPVIIKNNQSLMDINIGEGKNDKIINDLIKYYGLKVTDFNN